MFVFSTGSLGSEISNVGTVRIDLMNKTQTTQSVRILVFDTTTSPKTTKFDSGVFQIPPQSADFRSIDAVDLTNDPPLTQFPDEFEVVIRTNSLNVVPFITSITTAGVADPLKSFKYGNFFVEETPGVSV